MLRKIKVIIQKNDRFIGKPLNDGERSAIPMLADVHFCPGFPACPSALRYVQGDTKRAIPSSRAAGEGPFGKPQGDKRRSEDKRNCAQETI